MYIVMLLIFSFVAESRTIFIGTPAHEDIPLTICEKMQKNCVTSGELNAGRITLAFLGRQTLASRISMTQNGGLPSRKLLSACSTIELFEFRDM